MAAVKENEGRLVKQGEQELENLRRRVDLIAGRYGWSKKQVLALPIQEREWFIETVQEYNKQVSKSFGG